MSRSYPSTPGDRVGHPAVVLLALLAIGALLVACAWGANHPHSPWTVALTVVLVTIGVAVTVAALALAPVAARQAGGRR
jgi:MFS family permease